MFNTIILEISIFWKYIFKEKWIGHLFSLQLLFCIVLFLFTALRICKFVTIGYAFWIGIYVTECDTTMAFHFIEIKRFLVATKRSSDIVLFIIVIRNRSWRIVGLMGDYRGESIMGQMLQKHWAWYEWPL